MRGLRDQLVRAMLVMSIAGAGTAQGAGLILATPPLVGNDTQHVVCLVSNVGTRYAPFRVVVAGNSAMEDVGGSNAPLPPGSFNGYASTQFEGYCKVEVPQAGIARGLRVAACVAGSDNVCTTTVEGR